MRAGARALAALATVAACSGETGTLSVTLTQAPGSTLLDSVQTLRMTLTDPRRVVTADRTSAGFSLELELEASGGAAALHVEGLDASGALVANGASPRFPLGALSGSIVVYMAAPLSVAASPRALDPVRSELAVGTLPYGAIFAGGRLATGAPSDAIAVYNAFDHSLVGGVPLPAPRAAMSLVVGSGNIAFLFGGVDETGAPTANLWRFDTTVAPAGAYVDFGSKEGFARAGEAAVPIGNDRFLVTGTPPVELRAVDGSAIARDTVASLPSAGVSLLANDGMLTSLFAGETGVVSLRNAMWTSLAIPEAARAGARVVALPGGKVVVLCGTTEAVRIDAASGSAEVVPGVPSVAKTGCAAAATTRHLVVAGGTTPTGIDGVVEVYDTATLSRIAAVPQVVPRTGAVAVALPNDQILFAGGVDASGAPVGTLELFTPPLE